METLGQRIRKYRVNKGMTQLELARAAGVDASAVSQWESDKTKPSARNTYYLSRALSISMDQIIPGVKYPTRPSIRVDEDGNTIKEKPTEYAEYKRIPVITYKQAGEPLDEKDFKKIDEHKTIRTFKKGSEMMYAVEVSGESMMSNFGQYSFPEGDYIVVDPEQKHETTNGIFVLAKEEKSNAVVFRQLRYEGSELYLNPLNIKHEAYTGKFIIIGKVIDHIPKDLP